LKFKVIRQRSKSHGLLACLGYVSAVDSEGLFSLNFSGWLRKKNDIVKPSALWRFNVIQGHWFWRQSTAHIIE